MLKKKKNELYNNCMEDLFNLKILLIDFNFVLVDGDKKIFHLVSGL